MFESKIQELQDAVDKLNARVTAQKVADEKTISDLKAQLADAQVTVGANIDTVISNINKVHSI